MRLDELRQHRRDFHWNCALLGDLPVLLIQYTARSTRSDPVMLALADAGWRPAEQIAAVPDPLTIAGDHMEADWIRSGDPDTYEGLGDMTAWLAAARTRGQVIVACAPGLLDRSERAGHVVWDGALTALAPVRDASHAHV
jgi:hypothetical protein